MPPASVPVKPRARKSAASVCSRFQRSDGESLVDRVSPFTVTINLVEQLFRFDSAAILGSHAIPLRTLILRATGFQVFGR